MSLTFSSVFGQLQWGSYDLQLDQSVTTIYTDTANDLLYVAGKFAYVNGKMTPGIAVFDGSGWDTIGPWFAVGDVYAVIVYHDTLFIGGLQSNLGGLKKWDGTSWVAVGGTDVDGQVYDLEIIDDELWVAGNFDSIGSMPAHGLARWDGHQWQSAYDFPKLEENYTNWVVEITEYKDQIYVGGGFRSNEDTTLKFIEIARWTGTEWKDVGGGIRPDGFSGVDRMLEYKGDLYVMGSFMQANGNADNNIMRWNGDAWLSCGGGTDKRVYDGVVYQDKLWITGNPDNAGGVPLAGLAAWDGEQWCSPGNTFSILDTLSGTPGGIGVYRDTLVLGGGFTAIDGESYSRLAYWAGAGDFDSCGVLWPVGLAEIFTSDQGLTVYPNPASLELTIKLPENWSGQTEITILNLDGRVVTPIFKTSGSTELSISVADLPSGVYILKAFNRRGEKTARLMKQ